MVGYWSFDEGSGNIAYDYSGNNNNGILYNGPQWVDGKVGKALSFDGVDDYISIPLFNYDEITVGVWFYRNNKDTVRADAIFGGWYWNSDSQLQQGYDLRFYINSDIINFIVNTKNINGNILQKDASYDFDYKSIKNWHCVFGVYEKLTGQQKLYVNGSLVSTTTHLAGNIIVPLTVYSDMRIGYSRVNSGYFPGLIDEVRIYNRALSEAEIKALYNATK